MRETIRLQPRSAEAQLGIAQILQTKKETAEAAAAFAEAQRLTRKKADAQAATFAVGMGLQKMKEKDTAGAIERFREAVRLAPDYPEAHYQLALALQASGARTEAQRQFAEAHRLAPHLKPLDEGRP
jgi:Tfp pilus assembly protein PilF